MTITKSPSFYKFFITDDNKNLSSESSFYLDGQSKTIEEIIVYLDKLINTLTQTNVLTINSLNIPNKTTLEIDNFKNDPLYPNGSIWYNTDINKLVFKTGNGTTEQITSV